MEPTNAKNATSDVYIHGGETSKQYWNTQNCEKPLILYSQSSHGCAGGTNEFFRFDADAHTLTSGMRGADGAPIGPMAGSKDMQLGIVQSPAGTWAYDKASKRLTLNSTLCVASARAGPGPGPGPGPSPGPSPGGAPETWYKPLPGDRIG